MSLRFGRVTALDGVSFEIERGTILCLLGASGSGKSSALRVVAGLERPSTGRIIIDGTVVASDGCHIEPEERRVGMVFQDFALFPHLTVRANVAFGLRRRNRADIESVVDGLLRDVGLADRADRYPHMLSGGERQRVALARALAPQPELLLMDEPFSSLDPELRDHVRSQTLDLLRRTGTTTILVTHDPLEAMRVADRIGVLSHGRLVQLGTPTDIYRHPSSLQMASVFGPVNTFDGMVQDGTLSTPLGAFAAPPSVWSGPVVVCVRSQHVRLGVGGDGVPATVTAMTCVGDVTEVELEVDQLRLVAKVPSRQTLAIGDVRLVDLDPAEILVFPPQPTSTSAS